MNITNLHKTLPYLIKAKITPCIIGGHGIGKSSVIKQYAEENGYSFHPYLLGQMSDAGDILGLQEFDRDENGKAFQTRFIHPEALPKNKKSLLFFDELNRASKDLIQALFQLVLEGKYHNYSLPEDSFIVVAMNPPTGDYTVIDFNDKAFQDRFCHIILKPTAQEFFKYVDSRNYKNNTFLSYLKDTPEMLEDNLEEFPLDYVKPSRRSNDMVMMLQNTGIPNNLLKEPLMGLVGAESMASYFSWLESQEKLPEALGILNGSKDAFKQVKGYSKANKIRRDALSTLNDNIKSFLESNILTKLQTDNLVEYLLLLPPEYRFSFSLDIINIENMKQTSDMEKKFYFFTNKKLAAALENDKKTVKSELNKEKDTEKEKSL